MKRVVLIGCVGLSCSTRLIASSMAMRSRPGVVVVDSLKRLQPTAPKTILFTEEGARQALRYKAEALASRGTIALKDSMLSVQTDMITRQDRQIDKLNRQQQGNSNVGQQAQALTDATRTKLRAARWENWLWRASLAVYLATRLKLI